MWSPILTAPTPTAPIAASYTAPRATEAAPSRTIARRSGSIRNTPWPFNRGLAYRAEGDSDHAIADYTEAIGLDPKNPSTFNNRGFVYYDKGDNDHDDADFNEAIRLNPAAALKQRGRWFFYQGDFEKAAADLLRTHDLRHDAYTMLWRYLARARMVQA